VTYAWQTLIYRVNIKHMFEETAMLNDALAELILEHYDKMLTTNKKERCTPTSTLDL